MTPENILWILPYLLISLCNITFKHQVSLTLQRIKKTIDAIERRLAIIGEALNKAIQLDSSIAISNSKKIIGLRHILVHDYNLIDAPVIWKIIENDIPVLKEEIQKLLS